MTKKQTSAFKAYSEQLKSRYKEGDATEHTYRPALQDFIETLGKGIKATNEPGKKGRGSNSMNKPDFIIKKGSTPLGFIETKDITVGIKDTEDTEQIERYCAAFPNLIVTNYLQFRRYVRGELRAEVSIGKRAKNDLALGDDGGSELVKFFEDFLLEDAFTVTSAAELADRLAGLTRQIRKLVRKELATEEESAQLHKLMLAFKKVLLADLNEDTFSDMFAQTLAYGFFAARVHFDGKGEFSRRTASSILPKTNPFLRKLFHEFANENLPDALIGAVDDIVDLLKKTDTKAILQEFGLQGKNDAVIHFYESFLSAFDPKLKKEMGVFYTPDSVVEYMAKSLDEILTTKFNRKKGLADDKTLILDPALGTGSYLHKIIEKIHAKVQKGVWDSYVSDNLLERIFGFEILMAPYAVAHLNLGIQLQKTGYTFSKDQRLGVFLTNTLEETAKRSEVLFADWISEEADAAASIKRDKPIMVVTGNPPYSADSQNDGPWIRGLMRGHDSITNKKCANYFECEGRPLGEKNPRWLNDDYVKFIRFAHWRVEQSGNGVVAFITNHGYLENPTFRGMRESLMLDFDEIYLLDLHGNSKRKEISPDGTPDKNVFDIQQGVSICFLFRQPNRKSGERKLGKVFKADLWGTKKSKFEWLNDNSFSSTKFKEIFPVAPSFTFAKQNHKLREEYNKGISIDRLFPLNGSGLIAGRDELSVHFDQDKAWKTVRDFAQMKTEEAREQWNLGKDARDWKVSMAQKDLQSSPLKKENIVSILYRPFDFRHIYYKPNNKGYLRWPKHEIMKHMLHDGNLGLVSARSNKSSQPNHFFVTSTISEAKTGEATTQSSLFPLYLMDGKKKTPNIDAEVLSWVSSKVRDEPELRLFEYCYAILHSPEYRERYKDLLRMDFPKIVFTENKTLFMKLAKLGRKLIDTHCLTSDKLDGGKCIFSQKGSNRIEKVAYDQKNKRVYINKAQYFENVEMDAWQFEVGGYQVLEKWLKDRKDHQIGHSHIQHYESIVEAINQTILNMKDVDLLIASSGGWEEFFSTSFETQKKAA